MSATLGTRAIWERFDVYDGTLVIVDVSGSATALPKSCEATTVDEQTLYLGMSLEEVLRSEHDVLGRRILDRDGDPTYDEVAGCIAPIRRADQYTFVGDESNYDKVVIEYGGRTPNFDPAAIAPGIAAVRDRGGVLDGLIGGCLPVVRFVYPDAESLTGAWWEYVAFASPRALHPHTQPVWYRVCRIEAGRLVWARYFDSYQPYPPRDEPIAPDSFYTDLAAVDRLSHEKLAGGMSIEIPDERLTNQARHSLLRAMVTRVLDFPKYGVMDRLYGAAEHDGFQDTFNADAGAAIEWGLFDLARRYIDNYFEHYVRDDGSILYRGAETGQYGRMLTTLGQYLSRTGDRDLFLRHRTRVVAVADLLEGLWRRARQLDPDDPAFGVIVGWCEADSCLEADPDRYRQPYLSNSAEAARGFIELGSALTLDPDVEIRSWARALASDGRQIAEDLQSAIRKSTLDDEAPVCIPAIAGAAEPFHIAVSRDPTDPQFRSYRANSEMLFSGMLTAEQVRTVVEYRSAHRDIVLGVPCAYGLLYGSDISGNSSEMAGFLSYGHAFGLLQAELVREFLLCLFALSAHQYTRGSWTAPETRLIDPARSVISYAVPAQLTVPLLLRWALIFEDPADGVTWLAPAVPRAWLADGEVISITDAPTSGWSNSFRIVSEVRTGQVRVRVERNPKSAGAIPSARRLRLRLPEGRQVLGVVYEGVAWTGFDSTAEWIDVPDADHVDLLIQTSSSMG